MFTKRKVLLVLIPAFLVLMIGFGITATAQAVEFDEDGIIEAGEVIDDDLFISAEKVEIYGTVKGDVFASGSIVIVNGTVEGSLAAGGQTIELNGEVKGSVYAGGMTLTVGPETKVGRNMFFGGFNFSAEKGSYIQRDLLIGAYQALLAGEVGRNVQVGVGALEIDGVVGNDVRADVGSPSDGQPPYFYPFPAEIETSPTGIRISPQADIGGSIFYRSSEEQSQTIDVLPPGGIEYEFDPSKTPHADPDDAGEVGSRLVGAWFLKQARSFITLLLFAGLILWQLPELLNKVSEKAEKEAMPALGWGLVSWILVYAGAILAAGLVIAAAIFFGVITLGEISGVILTIGFSSLGIILAGFGLVLRFISKIVVAYLVGKLLFRWLAPKYADQAIWPLVVGLLLYTFLRAIPLGFGFVIGVVATLIGVGAIWLTYRDHAAEGKES